MYMYFGLSDFFFFCRLKTRLASFGDNVKVQKWLDLINFNMDIIRDSKEDCDVKNILDLARQSNYKLSQRSNDEEGNKVVHSETTSEHSAHKIKSDMLVLDAEKYLSSVSKEKGIYDKNLGKIHSKYIFRYKKSTKQFIEKYLEYLLKMNQYTKLLFTLIHKHYSYIKFVKIICLQFAP